MNQEKKIITRTESQGEGFSFNYRGSWIKTREEKERKEKRAEKENWGLGLGFTGYWVRVSFFLFFWFSGAPSRSRRDHTGVVLPPGMFPGPRPRATFKFFSRVTVRLHTESKK